MIEAQAYAVLRVFSQYAPGMNLSVSSAVPTATGKCRSDPLQWSIYLWVCRGKETNLTFKNVRLYAIDLAVWNTEGKPNR